MTDLKNCKTDGLAEDQLSGVTGGGMNGDVIVQPMGFRRCTANPEHVFVDIHDACPICGCREFTRA